MSVNSQTTTYEDRYVYLKKKKISDTLGKLEQNGYADEDDYGTIPLPDGYSFTPDPIDGAIYSYRQCADNFAAFMKGHPIHVDKMEILCGRWRDRLTKYRKASGVYDGTWPEERFPYDHLKPAIDLYGIDSGIGSDSHFCTDYSIGLSLGWGGLLEKIRKYKAVHQGDNEKQEFYYAEETTVLAIQEWIGEHIKEIRRLLAEEQDPAIRDSLSKMLAANENLIEKPPQSFLEACQYIAWYNTISRMYDRDGAGCWLDQILYPYYKKDLEQGALSRDEAVFILANLLLTDPHYYQLAGCDDDGNDLTNELSYLILEGANNLNITANMTVRVHDKLDAEFFHKAIGYVFNARRGWPRFAGHKGLMNYVKNEGVDAKTANERIAVGCGWCAVPGKEFSMQDCVKINCAKVFEVAYTQMMIRYQRAPEKDAHLYEPSLGRLLEAFHAHLKRAVDAVAQSVLFHLDHIHEVFPELVMNLQMNNALEQGLNASQCAELYTMCVDGVALGVVADSFAAIEQRVIKEKRLTWNELFDAVRGNFIGDERTRQMLQASERYCQGGGSLGDKWAKKISSLFADAVKAQPMPDGKSLVPGWFSWSKTIFFGKQVGATPNGRRAYEPVTHGANPAPGFRSDGAPSAMSTGIANIQPGYGNTAPLQIEFDPRLTAEQGGIERVAQLVKTHIDMGGTLININILDKDLLMEAHKNPHLHPDLVVRVTGFTSYFCVLSPEFRQLVVDRFIDHM